MKKDLFYSLEPFKTTEGMWGFKDPITEEIHIEAIYDDANEFEDGIARVILNGKYGIIDKTNNFIVPPIYAYLEVLFDGAYLVYDEKNNRSVVDLTGTIFLKPKEHDGLYGYVDYDENVVIPFQYEDAGDFSEGFASVKKDGKWGYVNKDGELAIPFSFASAEPFSNGFAAVEIFVYYKKRWDEQKNRDVWDFFPKNNIDDAPKDVESWQISTDAIGYINKNGEILKPRLPEDVRLIRAEPFAEGRAYVHCYHSEWFNEHDRAFYIDTEGNIVFEVDDVDSDIYNHTEFKNGYAIVKNNNLYGCIDVNGNEIVPCIYEEYDRDILSFIQKHLDSLKSKL